MLLPVAALVRPAGIRPGHDARNGTRMPPSCRSVLPPLRGPLSASKAPPLSKVKTTSVFSRMRSASSLTSSLPMRFARYFEGEIPRRSAYRTT
jgi:hypothetical protein